MKKVTVHYIDETHYKKIWIVAQTKCGIYWSEIEEYTTEVNKITCKKCIKNLNAINI
jgi:hypothetical protein